MKVALVGAGSAALRHAAALRAHGSGALACVVDAHAERAVALSENLGVPACTERMALANPELDAFAICGSAGAASRLAHAALSAGKAVLLERPVDGEDELERLLAAAHEASRPVTVMLPQRHRLPAGVTQRRFSGGASALVEVMRPGPSTGFDGAFRELAVDYVDLACLLLGWPIALHGEIECEQQRGVQTRATLAIKHASGALTTIVARSDARVWRERLTLVDAETILEITPGRLSWSECGNELCAWDAPPPSALRAAVYGELSSALAGSSAGYSALAATRELTALLEAVGKLARKTRPLRLAPPTRDSASLLEAARSN